MFVRGAGECVCVCGVLKKYITTTAAGHFAPHDLRTHRNWTQLARARVRVFRTSAERHIVIRMTGAKAYIITHRRAPPERVRVHVTHFVATRARTRERANDPRLSRAQGFCAK